MPFNAQVNGKDVKLIGVIASILLAREFAPAHAMDNRLPACFGATAVVRAEVARSTPDGVLYLRDGRAATIEGLLLPERGRAASAKVEQQALALLSKLVGQKVTLRTARPPLDRYGRLRTQVMLPDGSWLQQTVLQKGLARVQIAPDSSQCARELYAAEGAARAARLGLWALPQYAIRTPDSLRWRDLGSFQIVEGQVLNVKVSGRAYLNFGRNWRTDFTVTISSDDMKTFRRASADPYSYTGKSVRVRGYIDRMNGFEIEAASPEQIEMLK